MGDYWKTSFALSDGPHLNWCMEAHASTRARDAIDPVTMSTLGRKPCRRMHRHRWRAFCRSVHRRSAHRGPQGLRDATMTANDSAQDGRIDQFLRASSLVSPDHAVVPLTGDASTRKYFRVVPSTGPSIVLALHPGPIEFATLPFVEVADLLRRMPLPVPGVIGHSDSLGILALEDLGDVTLQAHLGGSGISGHAALYREAVGFITQLQRRGARAGLRIVHAVSLAFDVEKLTWELDFSSSILEGFRRATLSPAERAGLADSGRPLRENWLRSRGCCAIVTTTAGT